MNDKEIEEMAKYIAFIFVNKCNKNGIKYETIAEDLYSAGYGKVEDYKKEIERLKKENDELRTELSHREQDLIHADEKVFYREQNCIFKENKIKQQAIKEFAKFLIDNSNNGLLKVCVLPDLVKEYGGEWK